LANNIDLADEPIAVRMKYLRDKFKESLEIVQLLCCKTSEEEILLINFAYILLRGFREFTMIA
jgi:hypothetical protein